MERASGGDVDVLEAPSPAGAMKRLLSGPDAGKYVELGGPLRIRAVAEGADLHEIHTCAGGAQ